MFHRWAALLLVLALCAMSPKNAAGQSQTQKPREQKSGAFGKPYPNPFNPEIRIPFHVDTIGGCRDASRQKVVTVRISNILGQAVAVPVLEDGSINSTTSVPSSLVGAALSNVKLGCGDYTAYWDGFVRTGSTKKEAASGPYLVQIIVDGAVQDNIRILNRK
jgi:hypothetical protein